MMEGLELTKTELDKIYISMNFREAYTTLHHSLKPLLTTGRYGVWGKPKDYEVQALTKIFDLSREYNLVHILLEDVTDKEYAKLIDIFNRDGKESKKRSKK